MISITKYSEQLNEGFLSSLGTVAAASAGQYGLADSIKNFSNRQNIGQWIGSGLRNIGSSATANTTDAIRNTNWSNVGKQTGQGIGNTFSKFGNVLGKAATMGVKGIRNVGSGLANQVGGMYTGLRYADHLQTPEQRAGYQNIQNLRKKKQLEQQQNQQV